MSGREPLGIRWDNISRRRMMLSVLVILTTAYAALLLAGKFLADAMMFLPPPSSYADSDDVVKIVSADGAVISARFFPNPVARHTVIFSHGNAEDMGNLREFLEEFRKQGFNILAYDYSGYGTSSGKASSQAALRNAEAAYSYLVDGRKIEPEEVIVWGRSIGSGPSAHLAATRRVGGLVLESAFTSAFRVVTRVRLLPFDRFDNLDALKQIACPVMVMHGTADEVIPFSHGKKLYAAVRGTKMNYWVEGAGHNDLVTQAGSSYWEAARRFEKLLGKGP